MLLSRIVPIASVGLLMVSSVFSENGPSVNSRPATVAQRLQEKHVELTIDSLVSALESPDPEIRFLAAEELATKGAKDQIPKIVRALNDEHVGLTRVNIAFALAQLGAADGIDALDKSCADPGLPPELRSLATRYTLYLKDKGCIDALQEMLRQHTDVDLKIQAFSLLPLLPRTEVPQADVDLVIQGLRDPNSAIRISAAETLRSLGRVSAIPNLQAAIASESDESVKSEMQSALNKLQEAGTSNP